LGPTKATLLKLLTGEVAPDAGHVKLGTTLAISVFDQARAALDPDATLWDSLTNDPQMRVSGASDQVMVRGTPRHVVGYLKDFLFEDNQMRAPVRSLSGGEKARLLLARIMARDSNLLILDEPTNDLDVETLDLLQDTLGDFPGTVLLVSHDRDFIDRVATMTVAMEGQGRASVYPGGWSDYQRQRPDGTGEQEIRKPQAQDTAKPPKKKSGGLTFSERNRLYALPDVIETLEAELAKLADLLSDDQLFTRDPVKFAKASDMMADRQARLAKAEQEWLTLAERD
jgi:ABC transport system ATP-binding/permease protein